MTATKNQNKRSKQVNLHDLEILRKLAVSSYTHPILGKLDGEYVTAKEVFSDDLGWTTKPDRVKTYLEVTFYTQEGIPLIFKVFDADGKVLATGSYITKTCF